jgi:alkylation response protein AidB-like acyl-CoA dehydrogenase
MSDAATLPKTNQPPQKPMAGPKQLPPHLNSGSFLLSDIDPKDVFTAEDLTSEDRLIAETAEKFMEKDVLPNVEALEHQEEGLCVKLLKKAGELGLLGMQMDEEYGGLGLSNASVLGAWEQLSRLGGFGVSCGAHSGIGAKPLCYFGTEAQKKKYLPKLATGEWIAAFALTETGSGSDALGMKTKATLSPDGKHYLLSGSKMWITNAGWADLFTVYAKVDGKLPTAFLVERTFPGVSTGKEEHKMGIKSSSTRRVIFDNVPVPVENVLGEVGKGAYIAFTILNTGRMSLGSTSIGVSKDCLKIAIRYSQERQQFGRPISSFGLIQEKLANMATFTYAIESAAYRSAGMMDGVMKMGEKIENMTPNYPRGIEEPALECSLLKVAGTETMDYVVDEALQIHGGYGFSEEFPMARAYRDSRINRIFEGTNEINRIFIPTFLFQRAQRGRLDLQPAIEKITKEVLSAPPKEAAADGDPLAAAKNLITNAKKVALLLVGLSFKKFGEKIGEEQELLGNISDFIIDLYLLESAQLRLLKNGTPATMKDLFLVFANTAAAKLQNNAQNALSNLSEGEEFKLQLSLLRKLLRWQPLNATVIRRRITKQLLEKGTYTAIISK